MITSYTLWDNSDEVLQVASATKELITGQECQTIKIVMGYWNIPGIATVWH